MVDTLFPPMDLSPTSLKVAVDRYREQHDAEPWGVILDITGSDYAEMATIIREFNERLLIVTMDIPQDSWVVYGPHGFVISEGA